MWKEVGGSTNLNMKGRLYQVRTSVLGEGHSPALHCGTLVQSQGDALQPKASNRES